MPGRDEALDTFLSDLRTAAKLSVAQVCERTKIQARYVEALEAGRYGEVPSNTHLRAFSLAIAQACGGDGERATMLVRRVLAASAAPSGAPRSFDTPAPAPIEAQRPAPRVEASAPAPQPSGPVRLAMDGPALATAIKEEDSAPAQGLAAASARLRSLPLGVLVALLALAGALSYGASWGLEQWRRSQAQRLAVAGAEVEAEAAVPAKPESAASAPAAAAVAVGDTQAQAPAALPPVELTLRARRDCWLVLEIDGKRLPTITMKDGDKLTWPVNEKARLLAGNVGALRVWWRGDNLAYLGELGVRANALVFERGKAPRYDKTQALSLPPGVPD